MKKSTNSTQKKDLVAYGDDSQSESEEKSPSKDAYVTNVRFSFVLLPWLFPSLLPIRSASVRINH